MQKSTPDSSKQDESVQAIADRLQFLLEREYGGNQSEMARGLSVERQKLRRSLSAEVAKPDLSLINDVSANGQIRYDWLRFGQEPMRQRHTTLDSGWIEARAAGSVAEGDPPYGPDVAPGDDPGSPPPPRRLTLRGPDPDRVPPQPQPMSALPTLYIFTLPNGSQLHVRARITIEQELVGPPVEGTFEAADLAAAL